MLAKEMKRNWLKAGVLAVVGAGLTVVACESRLPQEVGPAHWVVSDQENAQRMKTEGTPTEFPTVNALIAKHYPPVLRNAGIGGEVTVQARIHASGRVERLGVVKSSGRPELDAAALKVLNDMALFPSRTPNGAPQNVVENFNLVFDPTRKIVNELVPTRRSAPAGVMIPDDGPSKIRVSERPTFTPYTERPELANREQVSRALGDSYPPALRNAGIGGTATLWLLLDETGAVRKTEIKTSTGRSELDAAAEKVGMAMKFKPARNGAEPVPVWIALPIVFNAQ